MAVPTQSQLHRPILEIASKYHEPSSDRDFFNSVVNRLSLREDDLKEKTSTGASRARTNISFALSQLKKAGLLYRPLRGRYLITPEGCAFLEKHYGEIKTSVLLDMSDQTKDGCSLPEPDNDATPDEKIEHGYRTLQANLADELLQSLSEVARTDLSAWSYICWKRWAMARVTASAAAGTVALTASSTRTH